MPIIVDTPREQACTEAHQSPTGRTVWPTATGFNRRLRQRSQTDIRFDQRQFDDRSATRPRQLKHNEIALIAAPTSARSTKLFGRLEESLRNSKGR